MKKLVFLLTIIVSQTLMAQNVGIGVTTPTAKLSISANGTELGGTASGNTLKTNAGSLGTTADSELSLASFGFLSSSNSSLGIRAYRTSAGTDWTTTALVFGYDVDNTVRAGGAHLALSANGNIGIGTVTPLQKLHVQGATFLNGNVGIGANTPFSPLTFNNILGEKISFYGTATNNYGLGLQDFTLQIHSDAVGSDIAFGYGSSGSFTETMRVKGNGNVGIGTASPATKLHVSAGDASLALFGPNTSGGSLYVGASGNQGVALTAQVIASDGNLHIDPAAGKNIYIGYYQVRDIYLNPNGGKVGIGNSNPAYQLDVSNRMRIRSGGSNAVSAGLWLNNNANTEAAFIGMEDDTHVGLFGNNGAGFKFGMNTSTGDIKMMGKVGIGTAATPAAALEVNGYTKLGSNGPSIKMKKLTGTTAAIEGAFVDITHGLDQSKMLSISVMVFDDGAGWLAPNYGQIGYNFHWNGYLNYIRVVNVSSGSASILSRPIVILITYEE